MDGKLLVLCDEVPGDYRHLSVKDAYYLKETMREPREETQELFVSWESIMPNDQSFINGCIGYARNYSMPPEFMLSKKGAIDLANGNIKTSIQEESYLGVYESIIRTIQASAARGEDIQADAIDLAFQYPFLATDRFLTDLSYYFNLNGVVRILPTHSKDTDPEVIRHRMMILEAWVNKNRLLGENVSCAEVLDGLVYDEFREAYSRAGDEVMAIMSLPIFGSPKERKKV